MDEPKEKKPRKAEQDKYKKTQVRMHQTLVDDIEAYAKDRRCDFSEATRQLIILGLEAYQVSKIRNGLL